MWNSDFTTLKVDSSDVDILLKLDNIKRSSLEHLSGRLEFPEPGFHLDFTARTGALKQFEHAHQMCLIHATHFEMATKVKTTYLLDAYLWAALPLNAVAIYSAARSLMELRLVTNYVAHLLREALNGSLAEWRERGERFFSVILRARFGTSDPNLQAALQLEGCPGAVLQPFRIAHARKFAAQQHPWIEAHYALLCDFVHPNLSSQRTAGGYAGEQQIAHSSGGGMLVLSKPASIIHYRFPMPEPGRRAVTQTAEHALENVVALIAATNEMPRTPYGEDELLKKTGSRVGLKMALPVRPRPSVGRNEPCPCGSGKKFKKCHGEPTIN